jgi:hypothetical protein
MPPTVLIIEPYRDLATAIEEVVTMAHCTPVTVSSGQGMADLSDTPAAIVVRVTTNVAFDSPHESLRQIPREHRPRVVALAVTDEDVLEAERLQCDVVLRTPRQMQGLYDTLMHLPEAT